jgi:hypothetical protein
MTWHKRKMIANNNPWEKFGNRPGQEWTKFGRHVGGEWDKLVDNVVLSDLFQALNLDDPTKVLDNKMYKERYI